LSAGNQIYVDDRVKCPAAELGGIPAYFDKKEEGMKCLQK
jgi:hypothetical protein